MSPADQARHRMRQEARARQQRTSENYATALREVRAARIRVALMTRVGLGAEHIAFVTHVPAGAVRSILKYLERRGEVEALPGIQEYDGGPLWVPSRTEDDTVESLSDTDQLPTWQPADEEIARTESTMDGGEDEA